MDERELQHRPAVANSDFSEEAKHVFQQQEEIERYSQQQKLRNLQKLHVQQLFGDGEPLLRSQQILELGVQKQMQSIQSMPSVKLEQLQMSQQLQPRQGMASVKLEQQLESSLRQQLQPMRGLASLRLEQQIDSSSRTQMQQLQGLAPAKLEQQIDSSLRQHLQQQQQQMQALQGIAPLKLDSRQHDQFLHQQISNAKMEVKREAELPHGVQQALLNSHLQRQEAAALQRRCQQSQQFRAQMSILQQQRLLQQQRTQLQQQQHLQHHLQQQLVGFSKKHVLQQGICARRLMQYMFSQRQRPKDNTITFWRKFVAEYFAPRAKKRWCVSQYGNSGRQPTGVFPQDVWHCEICGSRPGRGFETSVEVLPRLFKIKYDSGILDELLYVDVSNEYCLSSGLMVLEYDKAIQESIFDQLRVVRDGQLRIIFTLDFKIHSWEFCARSHEELVPRRLLIPQVTQLATLAQKYQNSINQTQNGTSVLSSQDLQSNCQLFVGPARQLAQMLEAPTVNDLGYTKRYVRCLQISEVVESMKDLIDFSRENGVGPIASLRDFPRHIASLAGLSSQALFQQEKMDLRLSPQHSGSQASSAQSAISNNSLSGSFGNVSHNMNSTGCFPAALHQNSQTSLQNIFQNNMSHSSTTLANTFSSGPCLNSPQSSQDTSIKSVQSYNPSVTGQSLACRTLSSLDQQSSFSSVGKVLQQSPRHSLQGNQQESSSAIHRHLQEMMMPTQLKCGASIQQSLTGGVGGNAHLNGGIVGVAGNMNNGYGPCVYDNGAGNDVGKLLISNAISSQSNKNNPGGLCCSLSNCSMPLNSGNGSSMNSLASMANDIEAMNALGGRLDVLAMAQEQNLDIEESSQSLLHELGGDDILSSLSNTSFNNLPFSWKSP